MINNQLKSKRNLKTTPQISKFQRIAIIILVIIMMAALNSCGGNSDPEVKPPEQEAQDADITSNDAVTEEKSPESLFQLGNNYYQAGQVDEAINAYKKAVDLKEDYDAAWSNLGAAYYAKQELEQAQEAYQKAIALSPDDADVIYNLGAIYLQQSLSTGVPDQQKINEAIEQINKAIELDPELAQPYYGLGVANQLLGNTEEAIQAFEKFLEIDDGSDAIATSTATEILQTLKSGQ